MAPYSLWVVQKAPLCFTLAVIICKVGREGTGKDLVTLLWFLFTNTDVSLAFCKIDESSEANFKLQLEAPIEDYKAWTREWALVVSTVYRLHTEGPQLLTAGLLHQHEPHQNTDRDQQVVPSQCSEEHQRSKQYHTFGIFSNVIWPKGYYGRAEQTICTNTTGLLVQPSRWEGYQCQMDALCWMHSESIWFTMHMVHEDCLYMQCHRKVISMKKIKQKPPSSETLLSILEGPLCVACT